MLNKLHFGLGIVWFALSFLYVLVERERGIRRRESDSIVARSESNGSNGRGETGVKSDGKIKHCHRSHVSSFPTRDTFTGTICLIIVME